MGALRQGATSEEKQKALDETDLFMDKILPLIAIMPKVQAPEEASVAQPPRKRPRKTEAPPRLFETCGYRKFIVQNSITALLLGLYATIWKRC